MTGDRIGALSAEVIGLLTATSQTVAVAESLTGGMLAAALTAVPGASAAFRGGIVSYAADLKAAMLGVDAGLLQRSGAVDPDVAAAMAEGACRRLTAVYGAATTGVAGPDPAEGKPVGTVYIAAHGPSGTRVLPLALPGSRDEIRTATVQSALDLLLSLVRDQVGY